MQMCLCGAKHYVSKKTNNIGAPQFLDVNDMRGLFGMIERLV